MLFSKIPFSFQKARTSFSRCLKFSSGETFSYIHFHLIHNKNAPDPVNRTEASLSEIPPFTSIPTYAAPGNGGASGRVYLEGSPFSLRLQRDFPAFTTCTGLSPSPDRCDVCETCTCSVIAFDSDMIPLFLVNCKRNFGFLAEA